MKLWSLGPDGLPTGEVFVVSPGDLATWAQGPEPEAWPAVTRALQFTIELDEGQFLGFLELVTDAAFVAEYCAERDALAVWESEGGWCEQ